jgi:acetyl-CoA acetyltransferase
MTGHLRGAMVRNPLCRQVAVVGLGCTDYGRDLGRSQGRLAVEACINALNDAGISVSEVDGLCGNANQASPQYVQEGLGIPELAWWSTPPIPFSLLLNEAANAVFSGACEVAVAYQAQFRSAATSRSARELDFIRAVPDPNRTADPHRIAQFTQPYGRRSSGYPGFMRRYMDRYSAPREAFGRIAINSRTNATRNPHAIARKPLTLADYQASRMVREPMCLLDMDYPVDGADAVVIVTSERARDLPQRPVFIEASTFGQTEHPQAETYIDLDHTGQEVAARRLWAKTDLSIDDVDVFYPYDGFTVITLKWFESMGFCAPGEAAGFVSDHWDEQEQCLRIFGRMAVNTHGGSLSEGATQGAGHIREAVTQLRGQAMDRQVDGAGVALLGVGGLFNNSTALLLST